MAERVKLTQRVVICPTCDGRGRVRDLTDEPGKPYGYHVVKCPRCHGLGRSALASQENDR